MNATPFVPMLIMAFIYGLVGYALGIHSLVTDHETQATNTTQTHQIHVLQSEYASLQLKVNDLRTGTLVTPGK